MTLRFSKVAASVPPRDYQAALTHELLRATEDHAPGKKLLVEVATGGGKTRIVNDFLATRAVGEQKRALVVTKDWPLLGQIAGDLCARHRGALAHVGYVGNGEAADLFHGASAGTTARIVFTTIQTWTARKGTDFAETTFDYIVIDEVHWGESGKLYKALAERYSANSMFIGATATPRRSSEFETIGEPQRFGDLVERGVLARPIVTTVPTEVRWSPRRSSATGDFLPSSLSMLAMDPVRNDLIVRTYLDRQEDWGKTLVFSCDIQHADLLRDEFTERGVNAAAIHSQMPKDEARATFEAFRESDIDVLVNVGMMTLGVDVPDIRTLFLCRPTTSEILFSQMVGRGSRVAEGKVAFNVVDFVDAVEQHAIDIVRPEGFLGAAASNSTRRRGPRLKAHTFEPCGLELLESVPGYEALAGLEIQPSQTFGIEFEATHRRLRQRLDFPSCAQTILDALRRVVPTAEAPVSDGTKDNTVWNVERDPSCGIEVTSRILRGREGFEEVVDVVAVLAPVFDELQLRVDHKSVGTHVHLGWPFEVSPVRDLLAIAAYFEPAIMSLVAPSRAESGFLRSARRPLRALLLTDNDDERREIVSSRGWKYAGVNPSPLASGYGTVEVRYHSGTIEAAKILQWISLWMRIMAAAERGGRPDDPLRRVPSRPLCAGPRGDAVALCDFVGAGDELTRRLVERRRFVVSRSWARHDFHGPRARRLLAKWSRTEVTREPTPSG